MYRNDETSEKLYNSGTLPDIFDIHKGEINFAREDVRRAHSTGQIDDVNRDFLLNLLDVGAVDHQVARDIAVYLTMVQMKLKPTTQLFELAQSLGLRHHPTGLDISGLSVPSVNLCCAIVGGDLTICYADVRHDLNLINTIIRDNVSGVRTKIGKLLISGTSVYGGFIDFSSAEIDQVICLDTNLNGGELIFDGASIGMFRMGKCENGTLKLVGTKINKYDYHGNSIDRITQ